MQTKILNIREAFTKTVQKCTEYIDLTQLHSQSLSGVSFSGWRNAEAGTCHQRFAEKPHLSDRPARGFPLFCIRAWCISQTKLISRCGLARGSLQPLPAVWSWKGEDSISKHHAQRVTHEASAFISTSDTFLWVHVLTVPPTQRSEPWPSRFIQL